MNPDDWQRGFSPIAKAVSPNDVYAKWKSGYSDADICALFSITREELRIILRHVKHLARYGVSFTHSGRKSLGVTIRTPIDQIQQVGDTVTLPKSEGGTRSNVYMLAKHRGWRVALITDGADWKLTAVEKIVIPPPRPRRRTSKECPRET